MTATAENQTEALPQYMTNAQGHLVPMEMIKEIDIARNDLVLELVEQGLELQKLMAAFKKSALGDIQAFIQLSAERYDAQIGGAKGNVTLLSYDGKYKLQRSVAEFISFDEGLQVAKELIDECIREWVQDSRPEIKALVESAFHTDKAGKINTARVLGLKRLNIADPSWQKAMEAISDSIQVTGTATYIRMYERVGDGDQWKPISLDIANL